MKLATPADPIDRRRFFARVAASIAARAVGVFVLAAAVAMPAMAGDGRIGIRGGRGPAMRAAQINARMMRQERLQGGAMRGPQAREALPPQPTVERPPEPVAAPVDRGGRPGRLTPEERRALRQQINDAGRDIYRVPTP